MKIYPISIDFCQTPEYNEFVKSLTEGDIELIEHGNGLEIWITLDGSFMGNCGIRVGPHFSRPLGNIEGTWFEDITSSVFVVANTKIARKLYKDRVWRENEQWILVKKN